MELIAVFAPFIAFVLSGVFGKNLGDKGCQFVTCFGVILAAFASIILFFDVVLKAQPYITVLAPWIVSGDFVVQWALRLDTLSVVMMCVINIVSACVHVYSVGYMSHDEAKGRFMCYLSLFTFAMLMLVTSDNLLQLFFGWEGVGLASYLLIGFWNHKDSANQAAQKAFIVNRVGDFGLALGIMAIFVVFGSIEFSTIFGQASAESQTYFKFMGYELHAMTLIGLLLFTGAVGKSAQLGLHTWLPDAMEGPTPVSALIHAATMVTAGVFLVARFSPLYEHAPDALMVVTVVGATTAFVAATIGMTQFDIKRVIAYSTMSQLGYMFFALGVSAYSAAMFHLMTHAFFKALLFLGAGSVIHALSDEQDMRNMGGIWKKIPVTYALMVIGSLALAGIPPLAGFYSKDIVLEAAWADQTWFGYYAYWMGILAAFMTAFYSWRLLIMTFHGQPRASQEVMDHVHESPSVMLGPLLVLASGAIIAGFVFYDGFVGSAHHADTEHHAETTADEAHKPTSNLEAEAQSGTSAWHKEYFWGESLYVKYENDTVEMAHGVPFWVKKMPLLMALTGIAMAYLLYMFRPGLPNFFKRVFAAPYLLFYNKWFFDELYDRLFVRSAKLLGYLFWKVGDQGIVDRFGPDGSAHASRRVAAIMSAFQTGYVFQYAFVMIITLISILSWLFFKHSGAF
jgi:NADH-quinone oxidoreductase subunit L